MEVSKSSIHETKTAIPLFSKQEVEGLASCVLGANYLQFGGGSIVISANSL